MKKTIQMYIHKYIPSKLYGFAITSTGEQVFFHLGQFKPKDFGIDPPPPPILGEPVMVTYDEIEGATKAPRASLIVRTHKPKQVSGMVDSYDTSRGYGFILGEDGVSYHLHNSEILNKRIPLAGDKVVFFAGIRLGKPRACHIEVVRK